MIRASSKTRLGVTGFVVLEALVAVAVAQAAHNVAPVNTAPPAVSGTATVGQTLTASHGTWSNAPTFFAYQWLRCNGGGHSCADVANGAQKTYALVARSRRS